MSPRFSIGVRKARPNAARSPSNPGTAKREDRPQFVEMVLHRRSGKREPLRRAQPPRRLRAFGTRILDRLRFVEHGDLPIVRAQRLDVALQQRVRREHDVVRGDLREAFGAVGAGEREHAQTGNETRDLRAPVRRDARRRDDQYRVFEASAAFSIATCASNSTVFPNPMSSASTPPKPLRASSCSHATPRS